MDMVWDDDLDFFDIAMILFTEGGNFSLEDEVFHHVDEEEEEQEQPAMVWGGSCPGKAPNLERHQVMHCTLHSSSSGGIWTYW
jgi:hypothetical protein